MVRQEDLERVQLLRDALDVVEPVDADHQLHAVELVLQAGDAALDLGALEALDELLGVDSNGEGAHGDGPVHEFDAAGGGHEASVELSVSDALIDVFVRLRFQDQGTHSICAQLLKK